MQLPALELVSPPNIERQAMPERPPGEFASLYRTTVQPLRAYLSRILGNKCDAQDVAHDAYLKVYEALDGQAVRKPSAFLFTIARRLALNHLRHRKIGRIQNGEDKLIEITPAGGPTIPQVVMARQDWAHLESIIERLPSGCRTVLRLSKVEYLTHKEIGQRLGIATSTVEKQHARALRLIFEALETLKPADRIAGMTERASNR
jgi:RNA polymerase sigma factor (sigma-70 family)